jgi:hypothetical protein
MAVIMNKSRWHIFPVTCLLISVLLICLTAFYVSPLPGNLQWIFYASGMLSLSALFIFRRELHTAESELEKKKTALEKDRQVFSEEKEELVRERKKFAQEIEQKSLDIRKKEKLLSQKLMTFHEWAEFPSAPASENTSPEISPEESHREFQQLDQAVVKLIRERTDLVFEKIRQNNYQENGHFRKEGLVEDISDLIRDVARIYHPESENPLLETSVEQLLRSLNRIALQLLVLLEQLPLDLKNYNLKKISETVQTGVKAYGMYKSIDPYWNYFRPVYYLGRFALGSNPVTLGVSWALAELAKGGSKMLASHLAGRYALRLLYEMISIIGNESAGIFGGDFRHREPNWIYAAELTELLRHFPVSQESLAGSLNEIGKLQLRSEYDRIFLYRCIANHKSAAPDRYEAVRFLSSGDRQSIALRLESFSKKYLPDAQTETEKWKPDAETRLCCKIRTESNSQEKNTEEKAMDALRSLAGFFMEIKGAKPEDLPELLIPASMISRLDEKKRREIIKELSEEPPMIFDFPDMEAGDPLLADYFRDIMEAGARTRPYALRGDGIVQEAARYFHYSSSRSVRKEMDAMTVNLLAEKLSEASPEKKFSPPAALALLSCTEEGEEPVFIYKNLRMETPGSREENIPFPKDAQLYLMGTSRRFLIITFSEKTAEIPPHILWEGKKNDVRTERMENRFTDDCRITGGRWMQEEKSSADSLPSFIVSGAAMLSYQKYFRALESG